MKKFALLICSFSLLLGSTSFAGDLWQGLEKKADDLEKRAETFGKGKLDLTTPKIKNSAGAERALPQKPHALAVKEYDGTEGTKIEVGGEQVAQANEFASAIMRKLQESNSMATDHGMLRDDCQIRHGATCKVIDNANTKFSTGLAKQSGGAKILLNLNTRIPWLDATPSDSRK